MLIDLFGSDPDAVEKHELRIEAPAPVVYEALWRADFGGSWVVRALLFLRSMPELLSDPQRRKHRAGRFDLDAIIAAGFGELAEEPGREIVLGVAGRFWRPAGNLLPFEESDFHGAVPVGIARAVWNFSVRPGDGASTWLETETRVTCADAASRRRFRTYWFFVRPFSGWIRRLMLRQVRREARRRRATASRPAG